MIIFFLEYSLDIQKVILILKKTALKNVIYRGKIGGGLRSWPAPHVNYWGGLEPSCLQEFTPMIPGYLGFRVR